MEKMIINRNFCLSGNNGFEMKIQHVEASFISSEYGFHQVNKVTK